MARWLGRKRPVELPEAFDTAVTEGRYGSAITALLEPAQNVATDDHSAVQVATGIGIVASSVGHGDLATAANEVAASPRDNASLRSLLRLLNDPGLAQIRVAFTERLVTLTPGDIEAIVLLATAYEEVARYEDAFGLYEEHSDRINDSFLRYLHSFNALMSGRLERSQQLLPDRDELGDDGLVEMVDRLGEMHRRADLVQRVSPLDDQDLRGWHFVITGAVLLTTSPDAPDDMGGRYAWLQDRTHNCLTGIRRLQTVCEAWGLTPPAIFYPPDRESQALAMAAGNLWSRPSREYNADHPGLTVVYALASLSEEIYGALSTFAEERPVFVHASRWTAPEQYAADITTLLGQSVSHPWTERMRVVGDPLGPPPRRVETIPADDSPAEVLAEQILSADAVPHDHDLSDSELAAFAVAVQPMAAAFREEGFRARLWEGGPVRSNRFL